MYTFIQCTFFITSILRIYIYTIYSIYNKKLNQIKYYIPYYFSEHVLRTCIWNKYCCDIQTITFPPNLDSLMRIDWIDWIRPNESEALLVLFTRPHLFFHLASTNATWHRSGTVNNVRACASKTNLFSKRYRWYGRVWSGPGIRPDQTCCHISPPFLQWLFLPDVKTFNVSSPPPSGRPLPHLDSKFPQVRP